MANIDAELLQLLVCPQSKTPLVHHGDWLYSSDPQTRRRYPIRDGIPVMLLDQSETVSPDEFARVVGPGAA